MTGMAEKKKPGRFTLQFNLEDPQQRAASELLEPQGRHKAQFIASAILSYIQQPSQGHGGDSPPIDEAALERMLLAIMEKYPRFAAAASGKPSEAEEFPSPTELAEEPWKGPMSDDAMRAIADTLAAFQTG